MKIKHLQLIFLTLITFSIHAQTKIELVKDINPGLNLGIGVSDYTQYLAVGNKFYFIGKTSEEGNELWVSDGTTNGTTLVKDITAGSGGTKFSNFTEMGGNLYFVADDGINGRELWVSDGTNAGTKLLKNIASGSQSAFNSLYSANFFVSFKNKLYFSATIDAFASTELWVTDGTSAGTTPFRATGATTEFVKYPRAFCVADSILYMRAEIDDNSGYELVRTNGTPEGTRLVKDIYAGFNKSYIEKINYIGNKLYFFAESKNSLGGSTGYEPWISDGTAAGTKMIKEINPYGSCTIANQTKSYEFKEYNGKIYFSASDSIDVNQAVWSYDPSNGNLAKVTKDPEGFGNQYNNFNVFNNKLYFFNGQNSNDITATNGTTNEKIYSSNSITNWSPTNQMLEFNNNLYITSDDVFFGSSILLEVTKSNTVSVLNNLVNDFRYAYGMTKIGNSVLLFLSATGTGEELYRIYNTVGTKDLPFENLSIFPNPVVNGITNFNADDKGVLRIYNLLGEQMKQINIENAGLQTINTEALNAGMYIVEFEQKNKIAIAKLMINK